MEIVVLPAAARRRLGLDPQCERAQVGIVIGARVVAERAASRSRSVVTQTRRHRQEVADFDLIETATACEFGKVSRDRVIEPADEALGDRRPDQRRHERFGDRERGLHRVAIGAIVVSLEKQLIVLENQERRRSGRGEQGLKRRSLFPSASDKANRPQERRDLAARRPEAGDRRSVRDGTRGELRHEVVEARVVPSYDPRPV